MVESRNPILAGGISKFSRTAVYKRRGLFKTPKAAAAPKSECPAQTKTVPIKGDKNGSSRVVSITKAPKFYPAEDIPKPLPSRKKNTIAKLPSSFTPGSVLILLVGRFRGKRVVFLKQLESGLLLVTGPYKVNGVPLKRVNRAYVIATSTKVDVSSVDSSSITDAFFKREGEKKKAAFFDEKSKAERDPAKKELQKTIDAPIMNSIKKEALLSSYLKSSFSLKKGQAPHLMKF